MNGFTMVLRIAKLCQEFFKAIQVKRFVVVIPICFLLVGNKSLEIGSYFLSVAEKTLLVAYPEKKDSRRMNKILHQGCGNRFNLQQGERDVI